MVSFERNKLHTFLDFLFLPLTTVNVFKKSLSMFCELKNNEKNSCYYIEVMGKMYSLGESTTKTHLSVFPILITVI